MEPRSNIEKPKDRRYGNNRNKKKTNSNIFLRLQRWNPISFRIHGVKKYQGYAWKSSGTDLEYYKQTSAAMLLRFNGAGACRQATTPWLCDFLLCVRWGRNRQNCDISATSPAGVGCKTSWKMRAFSYEQNITRWLLDVRISNETAIHFYKAAGFVEDGVRKNFYANPPEDAILMSCEVETSGSDRAWSLSKS